MAEIVQLTSQYTLKLPADIAARFRPSDRFVVWAEGDTLHLKRITPSSITETIAQAPEGEPLSLEEINKIVHQSRRQRRAK